MESSCYKLYTAAQVRGIDHRAIHELGIAGYELMCRAGEAVVKAACEAFPSAERWLILCGPGNNGGDGYVVARLAAASGIDVDVCSLIDVRQLKGDAARAYADWFETGGELLPWPMPAKVSYDLALDALLGTGIDREVKGEFRAAIQWLNQLECPRLAIDIASGLNADTGCVMGCAVNADASVSFVGRKRGMYTADGPDHCGPVTFDSLGVPALAAQGFEKEAGILLSSGCLTEFVKPRLKNSHKGHFGHVFAVGGHRGMSGAIRLCGEAALRSGAGLVTLVTDSAHASILNLDRPELMIRAIEDDRECLPTLGAGDVIALGPGLGTDDWSESVFEQSLHAAESMVVDADALNLLARRSAETALNRERWILTPHPAEAARLLQCETGEIQRDRVAAATRLARRYQAVVVLKGCGSVVAAPSGDYAICPLGNPGLASAGSGDVLTGIIAALLAQRLDCFEAACAGVTAHAMSADFAAEDVGQMSLIAGDIIDYLPEVFRPLDA
jgi:hydroxyethylthiazole kinase-like uncharacterized protein yjeF